MPHFPKPFFKKSRGVWYVEIDRKQINLGPDKEEAFRQYHQLMGQPRPKPVAPESLVAIIDAFLEWVQRNRAPDTYEWYRYRLQRFVDKYPVRLALPHSLGRLPGRTLFSRLWRDGHLGERRQPVVIMPDHRVTLKVHYAYPPATFRGQRSFSRVCGAAYERPANCESRIVATV